MPEDWRKGAKLEFLAQAKDASGVDWTELKPTAKHIWRSEGMRGEWDEFLPVVTKGDKRLTRSNSRAIFHSYGRGINTARDDWMYDFEEGRLLEKVRATSKFLDEEIERWAKRKDGKVSIDDFVRYIDTQIKWSRDLKEDVKRRHGIVVSSEKIRETAYRPFVRKLLFLDAVANEEVYTFTSVVPTRDTQNVVLGISDVAGRQPFACIVSEGVQDQNSLATTTYTQCFPLVTYYGPENTALGNITPWALAQFRSAYGPAVTERDVFDYVVALLHHPDYRERYRENLRRELPRVPLLATAALAALLDHPECPPVGPGCPFRASWNSPRLYHVEEISDFDDEFTSPWDRADVDCGFLAFCALGRSLEGLQTEYERVWPFPLEREFTKEPFTWRVEAMKLNKDRTSLVVNECLTLHGIPPEVYEYRLGNRSALEWVVDQYRVKTDRRSGIVLDPNRADDEEAIVRLVGQVIRVSLETNRLVGLIQSVALPNSEG